MQKFIISFFLLLSLFASSQHPFPNLKFNISVIENLAIQNTSKGRLVIFFSRKQNPSPIFQSTFSAERIGFAWNVENWKNGESSTFELKNSFYSGDGKIINWYEDEWFLQAVYIVSEITQFTANGNLYSNPINAKISENEVLNIELSKTIESRRNDNTKDTELVKYVEIESKLLSDFWNKPMKLKASVLLPRNFQQNENKKYPVRVNIGGYGSSWNRASRLEKDTAFINWWLSGKAPEILNIFPDGDGPYGDPYYIDSENNGPYGKALTEELIPFIEKEFRGMADSNFRFVDGCSTGGWVSLALQIFYPDYFNGAWSFSSDPVDFHHMQLINMYDSENAYFNQFGYLIPSVRSKTGQPRISIKDEVAGENLQSFDNSYITSGGQWGAWNALYSPKGINGKPVAAFDPLTGTIDKNVVEHWKKCDLLQVLKSNWAELGPMLNGKLWIWMGDMDDFYLNNAMREMDAFLKSATNPVSDAEIIFEPTMGHCEGYGQQRVLEMMKEKIKKISN